MIILGIGYDQGWESHLRESECREIVIIDPNQIGIDGKEKSDKSKCIQEIAVSKVPATAPVKIDKVKQQ